MFGLDESIAALSDGEEPIVVISLAILLGLRHAVDPDHLTAVSALIASEQEHAVRRGSMLGLVWGVGHATTLFVVGLPIVLFQSYLPEPAQQASELLIGAMIVALGLRLLLRWRRGTFHAHAPSHHDVVHRHLHPHGEDPSPDGSAPPTHDHRHLPAFGRSALEAYAIGTVHGIAGSAGVGLLLFAGIGDHGAATAALAAFALFTAISMAVASTGFGYALGRISAHRRLPSVALGLGTVGLVFGAWYALGTVPYVF